MNDHIFIALRRSVQMLVLATMTLAVPIPAIADTCADARTELDSLQSAKNPERLRNELRSKQIQARRKGCLTGFLFVKARKAQHCTQISGDIRRLQAAVARSGSGFSQAAVIHRRATLRREIARSCGGGQSPTSGQSGNFRSICVRTCDGYYFPISYSSPASRLKIDAAVCTRMYGGAGAELYRHPTDQEAEQAVSLDGKKLIEQPFAFSYRQNYSQACGSQLHDGLASLAAAVASAREAKIPKVSDPGPLPLPTAAVDASEDPETLANRSGSFAVKPVVVAENAPLIRMVGADYYYAPPIVFAQLRDDQKPHSLIGTFDLIGSAVADEASDNSR